MRTNEFHTFGPPGTGKTTWLMQQIERALQKYRPEEILVASFTRAAARELVMRGIPIPEQNVGTLHALCYRYFGRPKIAEAHVGDFNATHPEYQLDLSGSVDPDDPNNSLDGFTGDSLMSLYQTLRAKQTPESEWPEDVLQFKAAWERWCFDKGYLDFTMLIERGISLMEGPPDGQLVGFFDEAQDFTSLEFALIRKWANSMERVIFVGDDDQAIYGFKGGDPDAFICEEIPPENNIFLRKSYRLPSAVVDYSLRWIRQVRNRTEKEFTANSEGGSVQYLPASYKQPDQIVEDIIARWEAKEIKNAMILASCSYQLEPFKAYMYHAGIPFHNPYRVKRGDWNPIRYKSGKQRTMLRRFLDVFMAVEDAEVRKLRNTFEAFMWPCHACEASNRQKQDDGTSLMITARNALCEECGKKMVPLPLWSPEEFRSFMGEMQASMLLKRGAKKNISSVNYPDPKIPSLDGRVFNLKYQNTVDDFIEQNGIMKGGFCDLANAVWDLDYRTVQQFFMKAKQKSLDFPIAVLDRFKNLSVLKEEPPIIIGTIHSVKGGEADAVYVVPDLSPKSYTGWSFDPDMRDDIIRQFYVAMTRTRNMLFLCNPATTQTVDWL